MSPLCHPSRPHDENRTYQGIDNCPSELFGQEARFTVSENRRKGRLLANPLYQHPDPDVISIKGWLNLRYKWFTLHAAVSIEGSGR